MTTKIRIPLSAPGEQSPPVQAAAPAPAAPDGLLPVGYYGKAAALVGVIVTVMLLALLALLPDHYDLGVVSFSFSLLQKVGVAVGVGALVFGVFGSVWIYHATTYAYRVDQAERRLQRQYTAEDRARMFERVEPEPVAPATVPERIKLAGYEILALHYVSGREATRPECAEIGVTQDTWNCVNRLLQEIEVKSARGWQEVDYNRATERWTRDVTVREDRTAFVRKGSGSVRVVLPE